MQAQIAYGAATQIVQSKILKQALMALALMAFGLLILVAVLVSSITSNNDGNLVTGPAYTVTGSVMPPAALEAVFQAAANADGLASLPASQQASIRSLARVTGVSAPCQLPWQLLSAESYVESTYHTGSGEVSGAGAVGIMQFEPATFNEYAAMVTALNPAQGVDPPSPGDAPDAIYAADMLLCGDGATSGPWSVGDVQAVGQYNCGGTWISNPSACVYDGFTTADYVAKVHAVFNAILAKAPLGSTGSSTPTPTSPNSPTQPSTPSTPPTSAAPPNPLAGSISSSAAELVGQAVKHDSEFIYGVCQLASNGSSLPAPTGESSLTDISTHPAIGDFAVTPYGLGVVISGNQVAVVDNGQVQALSIPAKGWSFGIDPSYT